MTLLQQRFPDGAAIAVGELLQQVTAEPEGGPLCFGDPRIRDFLVAFARRLVAPSVARRHPELASLGFFLRRGELDKGISTVAAGHGQLRFPRGVVFHIPPANVDTIFVYSWALSALAGNANVVRISSRSAGAATAVLEALNETLEHAHPALAQTQRMITYGRDAAVTAELSRNCDLRVIWGGDESITEIRQHPLSPSARDVTFPDRSSFAVISADSWQRASVNMRREVAEGLYNDAYWFDQAACASPRALFWVGSDEIVPACHNELMELLQETVASKLPDVDAAMSVEKHVALYGLAVEDTVSSVAFRGNAVAAAQLRRPEAIPRRWLGSGTFPWARVASLFDLVGLIERRDQTVGQFGFAQDELVQFAKAVGNKGIHRIVPVGAALNFSSIWDGYDLLREFTSLTTVQGAAGGIAGVVGRRPSSASRGEAASSSP